MRRSDNDEQQDRKCKSSLPQVVILEHFQIAPVQAEKMQTTYLGSDDGTQMVSNVWLNFRRATYLLAVGLAC